MRSRFIFHLCERQPDAWPYAPASLAREGFVHGSFKDAVRETARVHFGGRDDLQVLCLDPRRLGARLELAATPRGTMPHVHGPIPKDAVRWSGPLSDLDAQPDAVRGTRFAFVAFSDMTLLDLVGVHDPVRRIASMGFDATTSCELVAAHEGPVWTGDGAQLTCARVRPELSDFDVLVVPGGPGARARVDDASLVSWLRTFPSNRLVVSVCTGALLLGAMGRLAGRRATTHASALERLPAFGATVSRERVVDEGDVITAGGVTSGIDAGLHVVRSLMGDDVAARVAAQMEWR
jgi:cyclohexyl-isocyanide hydratase